MPPILLSLSICVLGYAAVALVQLPNAMSTQASDAEEDERRAHVALVRPR
jgi:hypothetical protein